MYSILPRTPPISSGGAQPLLRAGKILRMKQETARNEGETPEATADEAQPSTAEAAETHTEDHGESGWVTTDVAAGALRRSPRRVREYIRRGLLTAKTEGEGVGKRWLVSIDSLNALLHETGHTKGSRPDGWTSARRRPRSARKGMNAAEDAVVDAAELLDTVQELQYRLGQAEARAELGEKAESTLREAHERLLTDLERERERVDQLQEELQQARRGWLRRFFGF